MALTIDHTDKPLSLTHQHGPGSPPPRPNKHDWRTVSHSRLGPPLDFSFQEFQDLHELKDHDPNSGTKKVLESELEEKKAQKEAEKKQEDVRVIQQTNVNARQRSKKKKKEPLLTTGVRLSYCDLTSLEGLEQGLCDVMDDPYENLHWLDLSHNQLSSIDSVLLKFKNLKVIYLHGNVITNIREVYKLGRLPNIAKLTLHGNFLISVSEAGERQIKRLEDVPFYRVSLISRLAGCELKSLDFISVTPEERVAAFMWAEKRKQRRAEK